MRRSPGSWVARIALAGSAALAGGCLESPPTDRDQELDCPGNLVANPSFEDGTSGWFATFGTAVIVEGGYHGASAVEVCSDGTSDDEGYYSFDDEPAAVLAPLTGEAYQLAGWVRAGPQVGPQNMEIVVREYADDGSPHPSHTTFSPDDEWRRVTTSLVVQSAKPDNVDAYLASTDPVLGNCFQVDAICLVRLE